MTVLRLASALALAAALAGSATAVSAQTRDGADALPRRSVTLQVGGLVSDVFISEAQQYPTVGVLADWRISRYVLAEVGSSYTRGRVEVANHTGPVTTYKEETTQLATATVGMQAELPLPYVRPYVGIASGLFLRLDVPGGDRFLSTTQAFPVGVRVPVTARMAARGEVRVRYDNHWGDQGTTLGAEATVGMSWRF
jgi:hypothetical protein